MVEKVAGAVLDCRIGRGRTRSARALGPIGAGENKEWAIILQGTWPN